MRLKNMEKFLASFNFASFNRGGNDSKTNDLKIHTISPCSHYHGKMKVKLPDTIPPTISETTSFEDIVFITNKVLITTYITHYDYAAHIFYIFLLKYWNQ
jgi:hypothetical protein